MELLNSLLIKVITKFTQSPDCSLLPQAAASRNADTGYKQILPTADSTSRKKPTKVEIQIQSWKFFPNPTNDFLNVEIEGNVKEIFITDVAGKIILRKEPSGKRTVFNFLNYPTGIYFLKFHTGEKWESGKFVVNKI